MFFESYFIVQRNCKYSKERRKLGITEHNYEVQLHFKMTQFIYQLDLIKTNFNESISEHFFSISWKLIIISDIF